jgi:phage pi2 protein 07
MASHAITIPLNSFHGSAILVDKREYEELKRKARERDEIIKRETSHALRVIKAGEKEYKSGKTRVINSSAELIK